MSSAPHYVDAADGTRIAYRSSGQGPTIVLVNGLSTSGFFWHYLRPRWESRYRVVDWDYKGHGASEPARSDEGCTIEALVDDMKRVMEAAKVERAVMIGFSMGCQVMAEAWRQWPERIAGLGYVLGPAGRMFDVTLQPVAGPALLRIFKRVPGPWLSPVFGIVARALHWPGMFQLGRLCRMYSQAIPSDVDRYVDHFGCIDGPTLAKIAVAASDHDARDILPTITVPTVVVAGDRDIFAPPRTVGLPMHAKIPGARLLRLPTGTHCGLFEHPEAIGAQLDRLLADAWPS